jgi:uncharacterized protein YceK
MKKVLLCLIAFSFTLLSGCAFLQDNPNTAKLTTQYATAKVIDGDTDRAQRIIGIVSEARATIGQDAVSTVAALDAFVRSKINWSSLAPEDSILIDAVLANAADSLEQEIGAGLLSPDERVLLDTFLGWIEDTAKRYAPVPVAFATCTQIQVAQQCFQG